MATFSNIPRVVIDYVRTVFAAANDKSARTLSVHPNMYEETLDHILVMELTAYPSAFFAQERASVVIESHWLGSRHMFGRWEIADIAIFVILRQQGILQQRKVALLQTKRLYANELAGAELDEADYRIGIARIADRTDPILSGQRVFSFDETSQYRALQADDEQTKRIEAYMAERHIPVYYGFHNPVRLPYKLLYPSPEGAVPADKNLVGCRVIPASHVHKSIAGLPKGQSPSFVGVRDPMLFDPADPLSDIGWRLERFVADEVMRCQQGALFDDLMDPNLRALFFGRAAPITGAITITVDLSTSAG